MKFRKTVMLAGVLASFAGLAAFGCGDDGSSGDAGADTDTDTDTDTDADGGSDYEITATISVPGDFAAVPVSLMPVFYTEYPPSMGGMPAGMGDQFEDPAIGPATPFELSTQAYELMTTTQIADGTYYMAVVLYVEGGGTTIPKVGVDWVGTSPTAIVIPATGTVDVGDIELSLFEGAPDGGVDGGN